MKPIEPLQSKTVDRFWAKVAVTSDPDKCWNWIGAKVPCGYGNIRINGCSYGSHRIAFYLANGECGEKHILHKCDNPACVNPNHLSAGTHHENMLDMVSKGRHGNTKGMKYAASTYRGEKINTAKLTENQVIEIRNILALKSITQKEVAKQYGITRSTVVRILNKTIWEHI